MRKLISLLLALVLCLAVCAGTAEQSDVQDVFGTQEGSRYENPVMGLGCTLDGWKYHSQEEILARYNLLKESSTEDVAEILENNTSVMVMSAQSPDELQNVNCVVDSAAALYVKVYGEESYFQALKDTYAEIAPGQGWSNFTAEIVQRDIGGKTVSGLKCQYVINGIQIYQLQLAYLNGEYMDICTISCYFTDECDSILKNFYWLNR